MFSVEHVMFFKFDHFVKNTFVNESMLKAQLKYYNLI